MDGTHVSASAPISSPSFVVQGSVKVAVASGTDGARRATVLFRPPAAGTNQNDLLNKDYSSGQLCDSIADVAISRASTSLVGALTVADGTICGIEVPTDMLENKHRHRDKRMATGSKYVCHALPLSSSGIKVGRANGPTWTTPASLSG